MSDQAREPRLQVPACDRCTQGVMDATNSHYLGLCACACHAHAERALATVVSEREEER